MSKKHQITNEEIIDLGKQIFQIIDAWLTSDEGWHFQEETHDVRMYKYVLVEYLSSTNCGPVGL